MHDAVSTPLIFGGRVTRKQQWLRALFFSGPGILWITVFLLLPLLGLLVVSWMSKGPYGGFTGPVTSYNYQRFFGFGLLGFDPLYPVIIARSLMLGAATAALCVVLGLPLAFWIASLPPRFKNVALTLVVIPLWTNLMVRTYAWRILLAPGSWLSELAAAVGYIAPGEGLHPGAMAVYLGMACDFLPFLVLPVYASVEKVDWSLAEAAFDLGANRAQVFRHALLPQIIPGLLAGIIMVFIPATGQFVIPDLLGGAKTIILGNAIQQQFFQSRDWPFGSAIAFLSLTLVLGALWLQARVAARRGVELDMMSG